MSGQVTADIRSFQATLALSALWSINLCRLTGVTSSAVTPWCGDPTC
jgi:hypothetical protein